MNRKILMRFDDICPTMDWEQWNIAVGTMGQYGIRPVIGVIPYCGDPDLMISEEKTDFWEYLKELERAGYTIAMHGYRHVYDIEHKGIVNYSLNSEFAGHTYDTQYEKIRKGKILLEKKGIFTNIFFAPAHSYDYVTLNALAANGFKYVIDGKSMKLTKVGDVICIPCRDAGVPKIHKRGNYVAVFHAHEWVYKKREFDKFVRLCQTYSKDMVCFENYIEQSIGNFYLQAISEKIFIFYDEHVRPLLSRLKQTLIEVLDGRINRGGNV